jgi:hypothetical protein
VLSGPTGLGPALRERVRGERRAPSGEQAPAAGRLWPSLGDELLVGCQAMARHALASGLSVAGQILQDIERLAAVREASRGDDAWPPSGHALATLVRAHAELARLVAPATPRTILLLAESRDARLGMLGPVRLVRHMLVAVVVLLVAFVTLAMSAEINLSGGDIFRQSGLPVLLNELFFLAAGGLGASFYALFTAYRYVAAGTYDPKYESTYWIRFILGLMAGLLLPALIPAGGGETLTRPLLALLGGFSAVLLYRLLESLVESVEALIKAGPRERRAQAAERAARDAADAASRERLALIGELRRLEETAERGGDARELARALQRLQDSLAPARADGSG